MFLPFFSFCCFLFILAIFFNILFFFYLIIYLLFIVEVCDESKKRSHQNSLKFGSTTIVTNLEYVKCHRMIPFFIAMCAKRIHAHRMFPSMRILSVTKAILKKTSYVVRMIMFMYKKKARKRNFRQQWLDIEGFKFWLREEPNDANSFYCLI